MLLTLAKLLVSRGGIGLLAFPIAFMSTILAADALTSGVPVGRRPGPYSFLVATGPQRGQPTCYICEQAENPSAVVFARSLTPTLGKLLTKFDEQMTRHKAQGFKAWMTLLAASADLEALAKWSQQQGLRSLPVGTFEDVDGPPAYTLAPEADITVLLFTKEKVVANFAFRKGQLNETSIDIILESLREMLKEK